jgi:LDH2 family malate/lactate/ureidoglycolate dehydrogenase
MYRIALPEATNFAQQVFVAMGCSEIDAAIATDNLLAADLRGVESHGLARLSGYVRLWQQGRINTHPAIKIIRQNATSATMDADAGLGLVVATQAMDLAIEKALVTGAGFVAVQNSNHFGIAGNYAMRALPKGLIGIASTNASPLVAPAGGKDRLLGTNPLAFAIPAGVEPPFVLDMATTTAANGKLEILQRQDKKAPFGWVLDKEPEGHQHPF